MSCRFEPFFGHTHIVLLAFKEKAILSLPVKSIAGTIVAQVRRAIEILYTVHRNRMYITRDRRTSFYRVCARGSSHLTSKKVHIISGRPMTHTQSSFLCCTRKPQFLDLLPHAHPALQHAPFCPHIYRDLPLRKAIHKQGGTKFDHLIEHFPFTGDQPRFG